MYISTPASGGQGGRQAGSWKARPPLIKPNPAPSAFPRHQRSCCALRRALESKVLAGSWIARMDFLASLGDHEQLRLSCQQEAGAPLRAISCLLSAQLIIRRLTARCFVKGPTLFVDLRMPRGLETRRRRVRSRQRQPSERRLSVDAARPLPLLPELTVAAAAAWQAQVWLSHGLHEAASGGRRGCLCGEPQRPTAHAAAEPLGASPYACFCHKNSVLDVPLLLPFLPPAGVQRQPG